MFWIWATNWNSVLWKNMREIKTAKNWLHLRQKDSHVGIIIYVEIHDWNGNSLNKYQRQKIRIWKFYWRLINFCAGSFCSMSRIFRFWLYHSSADCDCVHFQIWWLVDNGQRGCRPYSVWRFCKSTSNRRHWPVF